MRTPGDNEILRSVLQRGTGAEVSVDQASTGFRSGLAAYFTQLRSTGGPVCQISPHGLKRYKIRMGFGDYAGPCIAQMKMASADQLLTARALLKQIPDYYAVTINGAASDENWKITDGTFVIEATGGAVSNHGTSEALEEAASEVIVPILASMAELIGYDEIDAAVQDNEMEGAVYTSLVRRRERSSRNRFLCLSIHGHRCVICGFEPRETYPTLGSIIEVHHLQPLSALNAPREYDPRRDLVPLCPNCHRMIHLRRPVPYSLEELRLLLADGN